MTRDLAPASKRAAEVGHSMLELLVALSIVALLAALAQASYSRFVLGARRLDARTALADVAAAQERHYLRYARYAERLLDAPPPATTATTARALGPDEYTLPLAEVSPQAWYRIAVVAVDEEGYRLEARPLGVQGEDRECALFVLEATGRRSARSATGDDSSRRCWAGT